MAVAIEDLGFNNGFGNDNNNYNGQNLGVAGEIKYSGDAFSGEISGVYRSINDNDYGFGGNGVDARTASPRPRSATMPTSMPSGRSVLGVGFNLGDIASLSLAAAMGSGPTQEVNSNGDIVTSYPVQNDWWGITGLASANLSDSVHAEVGRRLQAS